MLLAVAVLSSCRDRAPDAELSADSALSTVELGRVGARIYNEPERVSEILEEVGLTAEEFEQKVRDVTNDPEKSAEYTRGFQEIARPPVRPVDTVPDTASMGSDSIGPPPPPAPPRP